MYMHYVCFYTNVYVQLRAHTDTHTHRLSFMDDKDSQQSQTLLYMTKSNNEMIIINLLLLPSVLLRFISVQDYVNPCG